ncbi:MAG: TetR/AcrR family transcriptional regulator [Sporolactobacillus sp.]
MVQQKQRSPGRPRQAEASIPTKSVILKAATQLFLNQGYQNVSIDQVASSVKMTKATVYYYFQSKAELFKVSMVEMMQRINIQMNRILDADQPLRERLTTIAEVHLKATVSLNMNSLTRESRNELSEQQQEAIRRAEQTMYDSIESALRRASESGEIPPINHLFAAYTYIHLLTIGNLKRFDGPPLFESAKQAAEAIMAVFWNGFFNR